MKLLLRGWLFWFHPILVPSKFGIKMVWFLVILVWSLVAAVYRFEIRSRPDGLNLLSNKVYTFQTWVYTLTFHELACISIHATLVQVATCKLPCGILSSEKGVGDLGLAKQFWLSFLHFKRYQADLLIYWIKCDPLSCVKRWALNSMSFLVTPLNRFNEHPLYGSVI